MKRLLQLGLLLGVLALSSKAWAGVTCAQGGAGCTNTTNRTCIASASSCNIAVASTHAGALEVMVVNISSATGTAVAPTTDGTWTVATGSLGTQTNRTEIVYNLNATGLVTTITCQQTLTVQMDCEFYEFTTSIANGWTFDVANAGADASCTACAGVTLALTTSNNYVLVQGAYDNSSTITAVTQYQTPPSVNPTSGNAGGFKLATTSGTTPTWTTGATTMAVGGVAIYENPASSSTPHFDKRQRFDELDSGVV